MQKKSLLVALFCGALCLTGCLKNEESASVAQVRIAKANELNSIADLNKAKAQAEVIYANAEATIANAEAKLREANAALVLAQAETEKVRAELLKVQVKLAEVVVDEEKVKLQLLEADLQKHLAEVEVAVAKAEAEKQAWINALENAMAQAEVDAINNSKAILEAEQGLEDYLLTLADEKATAADAAAQKYFAALDAVQELQKQQLQTKATKALVEAGAIQVRDAIHFMMDRIDDEIAESEDRLAYLKQYQTMTPEEAKEAMVEARRALNEAYNEYQAALAVVNAATDAQTNLEAKTADFLQNWDPTFKNRVKGIFNHLDLYHHRFIEVTVDGETALVPASGIIVPSEDDEEEAEFIPFWNYENVISDPERYPNIDVYADGDFVALNNNKIVPAAIYYDNIKDAMDLAMQAAEAEAEEEIAELEEEQAEIKETLEAQIENWKDTVSLHKKYIAARKDSVEKYEAAYLAELQKAEDNEAAVKKAWDAFQEYMLLKTDVSRELFIDRYWAEQEYNKAKEDSTKAASTLETKKAGVKTLVGSVKTAFEAMAKAEGELEAAEEKLHTDAVETAWIRLQAAIRDWNPNFAASDVDPVVAEERPTGAHWKKDTINAGARQDSTLNAQNAVKKAKADLYEAQINLWRGDISQEQYDAKKEAYENAEKALTDETAGAQQLEAQAQLVYKNRLQEYNNLVGTALDAATKAFNPNFNAFSYVSFPTESRPDINYGYTGYDTNAKAWIFEDEEWEEAKPGTAQLALLNAVKAVADAINDTKEGGKTYDAWAEAAGNAEEAFGELEEAEEALKDAIGEDFADPKADELYEAYLKARKATDDRWAVWEKLLDLYMGFNPDVIDSVRPNDDWWEYYGESASYEFGWLLSNYHVDYTSTVLTPDGETVSVAEILFEEIYDDEEDEYVPDVTNSLQYKIDEAQAIIDAQPEELAEAKAEAEKDLKNFEEYLGRLIERVNGYKAYEAGYQSWVAERNAAEEAVNEAKKAAFDAEQVKDDAVALYEALDIVANEGMWIYNPDNDTDGIINDEDFEWITIAEEIEKLEGKTALLQDAVKALSSAASVAVGAAMDMSINDEDAKAIIEAVLEDFDEFTEDGISIAELKAAKKVLQEVLKQGKVGLQIVLEAFDEEIAELDEKIEVYTKIAGIYKAVMNAYLGIEDEAVVEEPVDGEGEGDDEE